MPVICLLIRGRSELAKSRYPGVPHQLGKWGWTVNIVAALFVIMTTVVSFRSTCSFRLHAFCVNISLSLQLFSFPPALPVTSSNMSKYSENIGNDFIQDALTNSFADYVTAVFGIFLVFVSAFWLVYGSHFTGPVSTTRMTEDNIQKY